MARDAVSSNARARVPRSRALRSLSRVARPSTAADATPPRVERGGSLSLRAGGRGRIVEAVDLSAQPSRVVRHDALEHAHAFLELRDQRVALRKLALEICAVSATAR